MTSLFLNNYSLIFLGCGIGGVLRYVVSNSAHFLLGQTFPYGTLIVNVSGSFLMGLLFIIILERYGSLAPQLRAFLLIGLLGGYTTFSSFSIETINLFEQGALLKAFFNMGSNLILCVIATGVGIILGRSL
ncbi:MAG: fluoride efflux transporter CrcB [Gammaproteobacteria bacterium]|nr:fluoride efflux transporter CrcB [Gammaproteobacteria bacterium]